MAFDKKCGCYFDLVEDPASKGHTKMPCPLHSNARLFLEALKIGVERMRKINGPDEKCMWPDPNKCPNHIWMAETEKLISTLEV
jgi:hypothetical protein